LKVFFRKQTEKKCGCAEKVCMYKGFMSLFHLFFNTLLAKRRDRERGYREVRKKERAFSIL